ncbi:hypothetical protein [Candidatus Leptofilum sp.]|uniref:hypothetical protein n=1 Tax=Candidatus Leptofilum sp. TaxID=3241576 RepID=UPI003B598A98
MTIGIQRYDIKKAAQNYSRWNRVFHRMQTAVSLTFALVIRPCEKSHSAPTLSGLWYG